MDTPNAFIKLIANLPQMVPLAFELAGEIKRLLPAGVCVGVNQVILMLIRLRCWCVHSTHLPIVRRKASARCAAVASTVFHWSPVTMSSVW